MHTIASNTTWQTTQYCLQCTWVCVNVTCTCCHSDTRTNTLSVKNFPFHLPYPFVSVLSSHLTDLWPFCVLRLGTMSSPWASEMEKWQGYAGGREFLAVTWPCRCFSHACYERPLHGPQPPPPGSGWPDRHCRGFGREDSGWPNNIEVSYNLWQTITVTLCVCVCWVKVAWSHMSYEMLWEREEGERVTERDRNRGKEREGMCIDVTEVTLT